VKTKPEYSDQVRWTSQQDDFQHWLSKISSSSSSSSVAAAAAATLSSLSTAMST